MYVHLGLKGNIDPLENSPKTRENDNVGTCQITFIICMSLASFPGLRLSLFCCNVNVKLNREMLGNKARR